MWAHSTLFLLLATSLLEALMRSSSTKGRLLLALTAVTLSLFGVTVAFAMATDGSDGDSNSKDAEDATPEPPPPANTSEAAFLLRLGLGAEHLCAAGLQASEVQDLTDALFAHVAAAPTTMRALDIAYVDARRTADQLRRKVRSGLASAAEVQQLATAKQTLASAESARSDHIDQVRAAALAGVSTAKAAILDTVFANQRWRFPVEFLVEDRTEVEWVQLRDALATERIAAKYGEPFPAAVQTELATMRGRSNVAAAKVNLDTYLASVQTTWNAAVTR